MPFKLNFQNSNATNDFKFCSINNLKIKFENSFSNMSKFDFTPLSPFDNLENKTTIEPLWERANMEHNLTPFTTVL